MEVIKSPTLFEFLKNWGWAESVGVQTYYVQDLGWYKWDVKDTTYLYEVGEYYYRLLKPFGVLHEMLNSIAVKLKNNIMYDNSAHNWLLLCLDEEPIFQACIIQKDNGFEYFMHTLNADGDKIIKEFSNRRSFENNFSKEVLFAYGKYTSVA